MYMTTNKDKIEAVGEFLDWAPGNGYTMHERVVMDVEGLGETPVDMPASAERVVADYEASLKKED